MVLERQIIEHELLRTDPDAHRILQLGQEAVVEPSSTAEPAAGRGEGDTRYDHGVDAGVGGLEGGAGRLAHPERTDAQCIPGGVGHRHESVALDAREQHPVPPGSPVEEDAEVDLVGIGGVHEDRARPDELGEAEEVLDDPS